MSSTLASLNLLPYPRRLNRRPGRLRLPPRISLELDESVPLEMARACAQRLSCRLSDRTRREIDPASPVIRARRNDFASDHAEGYHLNIDCREVLIEFRDRGGLHAAIGTLRQLMRGCGRTLPCLQIRDWPDFRRRGVMLDVSRGRVPKLETLLELAGHLADFKINELQLYLEHTFAYRGYKAVWRDWGALTASEIRKLDDRCRELGIDLVPNQNSFGHLRHWLEYPPLRKLAEVAAPYESEAGDFLRFPSTLAPTHPRTLPFVRELYDELLPNFTSGYFNVGCDETWDLGRGRSRTLCERKGKGRVYLDFLRKIEREVAARGRRMMFWGDIILHYPELIRELPREVIALNWGYEADHPFDRETARFSKAGVPFYVCPGTSTWMTLIGRHDNALANLRNAARSGREHGAEGYLITDWGDGGHPQPLAVSYLPYLAGASLSWCSDSFKDSLLTPVLSRDVFCDSSGRAAKAARSLGLAHRKFGYTEPNCTPFGTVIAAPPPGSRELFCRNGLRLHARIPGKNIRAALAEVEKQRAKLGCARPKSAAGRILVDELDLAARMAVQSCKFMLWQQAEARGDTIRATLLRRNGLRELRALGEDFDAHWPLRNKGTPKKCSAFLRWRQEGYAPP